MRVRFMCALMAALLGAGTALAETGYIRAREAKVMAVPSATAEVVTALGKGAVVEIVARQGRWLQVSTGAGQGWVSALMVGEAPPLDRITVLESEAAQALEQSARRRASTATSAAAARGLRSDERARQSDAGVADFGALRQMERMGVSEEEAAAFMEQTP